MNRKTADLSLLQMPQRRVERFVTTLAAHPYLSAFLVCLLLNPLYFGSQEFIPNNAVFLEVLAVLVVGFVLLLYLRKRSPFWKKLFIPVGLFFLAGVLFGAKQYTASTQKGIWILIGGCIVLLFLYVACFHVKQYRTQCTALLILGLSFLIKFLYVFSTSIYQRQHDMGSFDSESGHASYIQYLLDHHSMPDFDPSTRWQYYHPPLHHAICALWIDLSENFFGVGYDQARESLQTLTLFYAMAIVITCYRVLRYFQLKGLALYAPLLLIAFHPAFILFSYSINNDALSVVFITGAIFCTLKWYDNPNLKGILKIALCVGLGMMTKLSAALIAIPIAVVFLVMLVKKMRAHEWNILGHYIAFLAICAPLGLWNPIRNNILFGLPLNYVQKVSPAALQYVGDESFWSRITDFSARQFSNIFVQFARTDESGNIVGYNENNPLITALKNFLFGEFINENFFADGTFARTVAEIFFWLALALAAAALVATIVVCIIKCNMRSMQKVFLILSYVLMLASLYLLAAQEPFVCSMNSRYITPVLLVEVACCGVCLERLQRKKNMAAKITVGAFSTLSVVFALLSSVVYLHICFYAS